MRRIEAAVLVVVIAALIPCVGAVGFDLAGRAKLNRSLQHAKQAFYALRVYAGDAGGEYPGGRTANEAFAQLVDQIGSEKIFYVEGSAWHGEGETAKGPDDLWGTTDPPGVALGPGENAYAYNVGLREDSPAKIPLVASAFSEEVGVYSKDRSKLGGVWGGENCVVIFCDGSVQTPRLDAGARWVSDGKDVFAKSETVNFVNPTHPSAKVETRPAAAVTDGGATGAPVSEWRWLHPLDRVGPAEADPDFHQTFSTLEYDDSAWQSGEDIGGETGGFGYGDDWFTGVDIGSPKGELAGDGGGRAVRFSAYFRCRFTTSRFHSHLELSCRRDDGIIVYIDGKEVARDNMVDGEDSYRLAAKDIVGGGQEFRAIRLPLDLPDGLAPGDHVLAISLHNHGEPSSDLRIGDVKLRAIGDALLIAPNPAAAMNLERELRGVDGRTVKGRVKSFSDEGVTVVATANPKQYLIKWETLDAETVKTLARLRHEEALAKAVARFGHNVVHPDGDGRLILDLRGARGTDAGLAKIGGLDSLKVLHLTSTKVTDAGLAHLRGMTGLEELHLADTAITDAGLTHLEGMTGLTALNLAYTEITQAGLVHLGELTGLKQLVLAHTTITDAGLGHLEGLTGLRELYLNSTKITDAGLAKLKAALPKCDIRS